MEITRILDLTTNIMNPAKYNTEWDNKKSAGQFEICQRRTERKSRSGLNPVIFSEKGAT